MIRMQSFILLIYIEVLLKRKGLQYACENVKRRNVKKTNEFKSQDLISVCSTVNSVVNRSVLFPHAECLHRSLVGYYLLTRKGVDVKFCLGVTSFDGNFSSHAWLEYNGRVINDDNNFIKKYSKIMIF